MGANIVEPFPLLGLIGTMLLADTHNMATLVALYRNREKRNRLWFVSYLGAACCIGFALCALLSPIAAAILARLYLGFTSNTLSLKPMGSPYSTARSAAIDPVRSKGKSSSC